MRRALARLLIASAAALVWVGPVPAAGVDCGRASAVVERAICANPGLSALDARLAAQWDALASEDRDEAEQRRWLRRVRDACRTDACLVDAYRRRIEVLSGWTEPDPAKRPVTGHFSKSGHGGDMQGRRWPVTDCLSLVPDGPNRARIGLLLNFANGHQCSASGTVHWQRDGYWEWRPPKGADDDGCRLVVAVDRGSLAIRDPGAACLRSIHMGCGSRGAFDGSRLGRASRRSSPLAACAAQFGDTAATRSLTAPE